MSNNSDFIKEFIKNIHIDEEMIYVYNKIINLKCRAETPYKGLSPALFLLYRNLHCIFL